MIWTDCITPGMVAVDVGANVGWWTAQFLSLCGENGKVYAIEPTPKAYETLIETFKADRRVEMFRLGLSDSSKIEEVFHYIHWTLLPMSGNEYKRNNKRWHPAQDSSLKGEFVCRFITLDELSKQFDRAAEIKFIKIDVDGYEYKVLRGAENLIEVNKPILLIEIGPENMANFGDNIDDLISFLENFGYTFFHVPSGLKVSRENIKTGIFIDLPPDQQVAMDVLCLPM